MDNQKFAAYLTLKLQRSELIRNLENILFNINGENMHNAKREICLQITKFDFDIEAKGYFKIDRQFVAAVS